jgi:hypothetical protein
MKKIKQFLILFSIIAVIVFGFFFTRKLISQKKVELTDTVQKQLIACQELTVLKYKFDKMITLKKSVFFGFVKGYTVVKFTGLVTIGYDTKDIRFVINKKNIIVFVPHAKVLDSSILEQSIFDEENNMFVPISSKEVFNSINETFKDELNEQTITTLKNEADEKNKLIIETMMKRNGFKIVNIIYKEFV